MFRQNTSSPKIWSLTCCKKWTWRRDASKFGELLLWTACSTKTLLSTRIKAFHIFPHTVASNVVFRQKYVLSEKDCLCPVIKIVHKYLMPTKLWNHTIPLTYNTKTLIWNISETHRFSPQIRLIVYPDYKTTRNYHVNSGQFQITVSVRIVCMKRKSERIWFLIMPYKVFNNNTSRVSKGKTKIA